jgi:lysophospholipase L1-like esterase
MVAVALCGSVELAVRVRHWIHYRTFDRVLQFDVDRRTGLTIPAPNQSGERIKTNSLGFRGAEIEYPKPADRIRLAFLGASTTFCAEATSEDTTWPAVVAARLRQANRLHSIDFINAGVGGYTLWHIRTNLELRVAPLDPDIIVIYEATNDLTHDTRRLAAAQGLYTPNEDTEDWLSRVSLTWFLLEKNLATRRRVLAASNTSEHLRFDAEVLAQGFEQRMTELVRVARSHARLVVLVTFCPRVRRDQSCEEQLVACKTSLYFMPYMTPESLLDGFEAYNRAIRRVAASTHTLLVDAENKIPADEANYNDSVHLKDAGLALLGRMIARAILESDEFHKLTP